MMIESEAKNAQVKAENARLKERCEDANAAIAYLQAQLAGAIVANEEQGDRLVDQCTGPDFVRSHDANMRLATRLGVEHSEVMRLRSYLLKLKRGTCWCERAVGNPMLKNCSKVCKELTAILAHEWGIVDARYTNEWITDVTVT